MRMHVENVEQIKERVLIFRVLISDWYLSRGTVSSDETREMDSAVINLTGT